LTPISLFTPLPRSHITLKLSTIAAGVPSSRKCSNVSPQCPTYSPFSDYRHIAFVLWRYTVFRIASSRKWNRGNVLFLLVVYGGRGRLHRVVAGRGQAP